MLSPEGRIQKCCSSSSVEKKKQEKPAGITALPGWGQGICPPGLAKNLSGSARKSSAGTRPRPIPRRTDRPERSSVRTSDRRRLSGHTAALFRKLALHQVGDCE